MQTEEQSCLNKHFTSKFCGGANQTQLEVNKRSRPTKGTARKIKYQSPIRILMNGICLKSLWFFYKMTGPHGWITEPAQVRGPRTRASVNYQVTRSEYCTEKKERKMEKVPTFQSPFTVSRLHLIRTCFFSGCQLSQKGGKTGMFQADGTLTFTNWVNVQTRKSGNCQLALTELDSGLCPVELHQHYCSN